MNSTNDANLTPKKLNIECRKADKEQWQQSASASNKKLGAWVVEVLNRAASQQATQLSKPASSAIINADNQQSMLFVECYQKDKGAWIAASRKQGMKLAAWANNALNSHTQ